MLDHLGINCGDLEASMRFYDAVLGVLGHRRLVEIDLPQVDGIHIGYGTDTPAFWISGGVLDGPNREVHVAFIAPDATAVRAFHAAALDTGADELHAPRLFPEYHERYFGAFVRDPDGNNVEAACHAGDGD